ncbi:cytochrome o ubiquinol oxidase subunit IV [Gluconobacter sp. LMG 1744]|uniref:Cytochrome bo(3) ubiquinol oxidase subunit 4 n=1 Tax=Gluconobacter cadivus TaxID=2728101 RepID=A0ABR9YSN2_9PROT|nr:MULTISPECIES: cytochrome o ubiquinol oxidase subunit IV [Gluconobacter]MBF0887530.1 cytochrome o ubiquinol oxidase subunit IV [Gluconobacter cadivus]MBF0889995.1 cytochrome o ubiquinol oxidase subunit IV [Gluconobacter cadivus]MBS1058600.1 cytochrome o ubiquinol oxidase subunit IV [Gluconobacter sp. Dm-44]MBS1074977.1 cytochrome o ubiquinol oxidase subunit IV [Gluconobacter sp. Dm-73]MBS1090442.1 cytochrome o ubiquinol oxidase subunit IV [Gluconobacter sp. Dm-74]
MAQAHTAHDSSHGSYSAYLIGFVLAVILTVASFAAVMAHVLPPSMTLAALTFLAVVQIVVHLVFFLHLNTSSEQSWNLMCFIFAAASVIVIIGGTIFIMHDTAINMMSR